MIAMAKLQVSMMYELMGSKKEDDEFVLQIAHSLNSLLACQATRSVLLDGTQVQIPFTLLYSVHDSSRLIN
jgi:hypothetical protein